MVATVTTLDEQVVSLAQLQQRRVGLEEAYEILEAIQDMEGSIRHLDTQKLRRIAEMTAADASLSEMSEATKIPLTEEGADGEDKPVLRGEFTSFGTWLGQRDDSLKEVDASEFKVSDDLRGCQNAKRNIVVAWQRGDLDVQTLTDYLDQRYATGDMTFRRSLVTSSMVVARVLGRNFMFMVEDAYNSAKGGAGIPAAVRQRVLDVVITAYENLESAHAKMRKAYEAQDAEALDAAMSTASWVNKARVRTIRHTASKAREGNKVAAQRLPGQLHVFLDEVEALVSNGVEDFFFAVSTQNLSQPLLNRYVPEEKDLAELDREARAWLKERGLQRQDQLLLSHVIWALSTGEEELLNEALELRSVGDRSWDKALMEAQREES